MNRYNGATHGMMIAAAAVMMCMTGCLSTYLNDRTAGADGRTTKEVTFYRGGLITSTTMDTAEVNYNGVTAKLGNYSNKGDAEMGEVITAGIIGGILAYGTGGTSAVGSGVLAGITKARKAQAATPPDVPVAGRPADTNDCGNGSCDPGQAGAPPAAQSRPAIEKADTASDVAPGKFAVVVLGNRKGCPLCRALWKPGFEADVEKALPAADVIDADMTENPSLYGKYFPAEKWVYPYVIVFSPEGERLGAFTARGEAATGFIGEVLKICPGCKPAE